jgi:hypothetical protein
MTPKLVGGVLYEFNESDEEAPGMGTVHYETLQQHSSDLFLKRNFILSISKLQSIEQYS